VAPSTDPALAERARRWVDTPFSGSPSIDSTGGSVLFLSDRGGLPQAWTIPANGGEPRLLSPGTERVGSVQASLEGSQAILTLDSGGDEHWQLYAMDLASRGKAPVALTHDPRVIHNSGEWVGGGAYLYSANRRDPRFFDVYEIDVRRPGKEQLRLQRDSMLLVLAAHPGRALVGEFLTNLDTNLFLLDGERVQHLNPHEGELTVRGADLAHDGVYAAANPGKEFTALVRYRPGRSSHEFVREYPHDVEMVRASPDGTQLALTLNREGWSELHLVDLGTGEDRPMTSGPPGVIEALSWSPDGSKVAYDLSSMSEGKEVYLRNVETGKEKRLTRSPEPLPARLASPVLARTKMEDGLMVPFWEYSPPQGPPRGTLLWLHGGPEAQARPQFIAPIGFLVAEGWRVIVPNVRGSAGYGRTYVHLDDVRKRMDSVRDVRDVAKALSKGGKGAPGRFGVIGGSYGGFLVLSSLCTYPEMWGAGVELVGIANFVTFLEKTGPWRRRIREAEYGSLEMDRDFLVEISPLTHVDQITAPLLVIHGANDPRVPLAEAEQIVHSLEARRRPVDLLTFPNEGHQIVRRENRIEAYARAAAFFATHLGGPPKPSKEDDARAEEARIFGGE
jgi:dipeptidyl aminopeptidase/acylaminoacyl peptidase